MSFPALEKCFFFSREILQLVQQKSRYMKGASKFNMPKYQRIIKFRLSLHLELVAFFFPNNGSSGEKKSQKLEETTNSSWKPTKFHLPIVSVPFQSLRFAGKFFCEESPNLVPIWYGPGASRFMYGSGSARVESDDGLTCLHRQRRCEFFSQRSKQKHVKMSDGFPIVSPALDSLFRMKHP